MEPESHFQTVILIQARFSSVRLPGKVLRKICNIPILELLVKNLSALSHPIVVLTSDHASDQQVYDFCKSQNITCFRGSLENVAGRFAQFLKQHNYEQFVRISADSPLLDPKIVRNIIDRASTGHFDLVTNVLKRTFPKGQSVELVNTQTFLALQTQMNNPEHLEHVTKIYYDTPEKFNILNIESGGDYGNVQLSVDTPEDFAMIEKMLKMNHCQAADWEYWVELHKTIWNA